MMNRIKVNFDEVICPNCVAQFRAIPVNVQQDLARLSSLADKWNAECDELREDNKLLSAERDALRAANKDLQAWYDAASADAKRYQAVRRGQKWSVIDGIGNELRAEKLDAAIDAAMKGQP